MEKGLFFDGVEYGAGDMVSYLGHMCTDGVIMDAETSLKVVTSGGLSVRVQKGVAYISGYCYVVDDGGVTLTTTSGTRTDIVVVKLDLVTRTLRAVIKQGINSYESGEIPLATLTVSGSSLTVNDMRQICKLKTPWADQNAAGLVQWYAGNTPPTGWLECNGNAVSRTTYAALFSAIGTTYGVGDGSTTFNLPDLRGEFVRGWDHGRGADSGREFGSYQQGTKFSAGNGDSDVARILNGGEDTGTQYGSYGGSHSFSTKSPTAMTHPRNVALLPIIKY